MNEIQVMEIIGGLAVRHPSIMSAGSQLISIYNSHAIEINQIYNEYQVALQKGPGTLAQAGIALELMKAHPDVAPLVVQILGILAPHIPELQQTLAQLQTQVMST
jgi:hypothetical protein